MKTRISSAFKHFALSVTLRGLSQRKRKNAVIAPQPLRQPLQLKAASDDEAWMFDESAASAVGHRVEMLSNEMDRLSASLSGLRRFLGDVANEAPILAAREINPNTAPMISDRDLFDGEPLMATPNAIPAAGEAAYLFEDELIAEGHIASDSQRAQAA